MTATRLVITSHASTVSNILIADMGIIIPYGGGSQTFTDKTTLTKASESSDLVRLTTDNAYGANASTLILTGSVIGGIVTQTQVPEFLFKLTGDRQLEGRTLYVDDLCGSDTEGRRNRPDMPFKTIQAAIDAAQAGDVVLVNPGSYPASIICKDEVSVLGTDLENCDISLSPSTNTVVVTMADEMMFGNMEMHLTPSAGTTWAFEFPGTTCAESHIKQMEIEAAPTSTGVVSGIKITGTGVASSTEVTGTNILMKCGGTGAIALSQTGAADTTWHGCVFDGGIGTGVSITAGITHLTTTECRGDVKGLSIGASGTVYVDSTTNFNTIINNGSMGFELLTYPRAYDTSTTDPSINSDQTLGYGPGSRWTNTVNKLSYLCVSAGTGAALWRQVGFSSQSATQANQNPGECFYGSLLDYPAGGGITVGEVQYVRIWLQSGATVTSIRCFISSGGTAARNIKMGIYDNGVGGVLSPTDPAGIPRNLIYATAASATGADNGLFKTVALTSSYPVTTTGYYWLALVADSTAIQFAVSASFRAAYLPVRREAGSGTVLPATAGTLTNPVSALVYVSAIIT